jgi:two-component system sensor histidine kinase MprB
MIEAVRTMARRAPLALRVALLTTTAVAVTFALFSTIIYVALRTQLEGALDDSMLRRTSAAVRAGLDVSRMGDSATALTIADIEIGLVHSGRLFESPDPGHTRILAQVVGLPEIEVSLGERRHSARSVTHRGMRYRIVAVLSLYTHLTLPTKRIV